MNHFRTSRKHKQKLKLTKTLSAASECSIISAADSKLSEASSANPHKRTTKSRLVSRLSSTCQTIVHLSSSLSESIHPHSAPTSHYSTRSNSRNTSSLDLHQMQYMELSSHRRKILGSVPDQWPMYSNDPQDYLLGKTIGFGASSVVKMAHFKPRPGELCAVKVIDIDQLTEKQIEYLRRETQLMSLAKHPNVLRVRGEWIQESSSLCIAMRLMQAGSIADLLRYRFQDGLAEQVIASVLIQAIAGLEYLHSNGWIHRDIKAANLLLDHDGTVLLADFGVSLNRSPDEPPSSTLSPDKRPSMARQTSFVGTALFMAPEVVTRQLYNDKSDIWSFGITALEMALGKAPHATISAARVLMKTVQEPSPTLDRRREGSPHEYSKAFQRLVNRCLCKDPTLRPTAKQLLFKEKFFRQARPKSFILHAILQHLPPLELRQERLFFSSPLNHHHHRIPDVHLALSERDDDPARCLKQDPQLDTPSSSSCPPWDFSVSRPTSFSSLDVTHNHLTSPIIDDAQNPLKPNLLVHPFPRSENPDARPNVFEIVESFNLHPSPKPVP
ncbi:hypothetical protein PCANC_06874 [Puccinia coronata f. sp. avenae]|uniref:Protein kinase domain-containing protein n=1 Tax=Puccinia coronata f. sp. avenae TaxID=200324 RepID=A0A2N5SB10_9BASI|nr:hypothetical protein PCASD_23724 [Puccinia coronata f. sp. avenae]PLW18889.1 hypothetical protein PCANC_12467 [Puccinia coronata f. sp. avenae]PLW53991.1 hypothetical protein PCANC_06874 [Puccinia coronata f. sp. avenae]